MSTIRKNALLLFSKPPVPGLVKTRLSTLKDGIYTPEIAAYLYHCMLFDVLEICCDAVAQLNERDSQDGVKDVYDIIISTTPEKNNAVMRKLIDDSGTWPLDFTIITDTGASFDEHYNDAFDQTWAMGYDTILSMGCDMPSLPREVILEGFDKLHALDALEGGGCVISPDQILGVSIVGWTRNTPMNHTGVYYNAQGMTVLPAYIEKANERDVRTVGLSAVPDVDTMLDLQHMRTLVEAIEQFARYEDISVPTRTIEAVRYLDVPVRIAPNDLHDPREEIDL